MATLLRFAPVALACLPAPACAASTWTFRESANGIRELLPAFRGNPLPATGDHAYDNWRFPDPDPEFNGQTFLTERFVIGTDEVADDAVLVNWQPGIISDLGWTYHNHSTTQSITSFRATFKFYDSHDALLGVDSATYSGQTIRPGGSAMVYTSGGFYEGFQIPTSEHMYISIQFSEMVDFDVNDVGILYGGPITAGDSSQFIRNLTTGEQIDLGDIPQANLGFFIDTVPVPAPGSLVVLGVWAGVLTRQRR
jgi:hypothetical protein